MLLYNYIKGKPEEKEKAQEKQMAGAWKSIWKQMTQTLENSRQFW